MIVSTLLLVLVGAVILFAIGEGAVNNVGFSPWKHVVHVLVGVGLFIFASRSDFHIWFKLASWLYWISVILLAVVLFVQPTAGSARWIDIGILQFQPSELAKLATVLLLARLFSRRKGEMSQAFNLLLSVIYVAIPTALVLLQPDLGTAIVFVFIWAVMIVLSDLRFLIIALVAVASIATALFAFPLLEGYQQQRVMTFLDPAADPRGAGYNVRQASIAIGSGGLIGQGLDSGTQSRLSFLPAQHTDFVFAVAAEKLGFIGATLLLVVFAVLIFRLVLVGLRSKNSFGAHVVIGIATLLSFHVLVNVGMNLGLVPVTGLPLSFISYGGTHLAVMLLAIGIAVSVSRESDGLHFEK